MKIAILDDYHGCALQMADWSRLDADYELEVFNSHLGDPDRVAAALEVFEILGVMRERTLLDRATLARLPNLKLIATTGMRNAAIDLDYCRERGITVIGTGGAPQATPELAWGHILSLARAIPHEDRNMRDGGWMTTIGVDLDGRTLGIVGLGRLGRMMARIGAAFGMEILAWSQNLTDEDATQAGATRVSKEDLFRRSDFVSIHYKLSDRSKGIVGRTEIGLMKPTAFLVNTSRGPLVDTGALIDALKEGAIAGAGIDVYDTEPLPADHPLRSCPRTVLTPHLGYVTEKTYRQFYREMAEGIEKWISGTPVRVL